MSAPVNVARAAEQRVDDDLGHRVAGRDQAVHPAAGRRALADRPDVRVGGAAALVDQDAAALGQRRGRPRGPARRGAGCRRRRPPGRRRAARRPRRASPVTRSSPSDPLGRRAGVHGQPELLDVPGAASRRRRRRPAPASAAAPSRRRGCRGPAARSALAASRPSSPPPITAPVRAPGRGVADRLQVLDGAVDEAAGQVVAGHRRHERRRAGGQHQLVVGDDLRRRPASTVRVSRVERRRPRCRGRSRTRGSSYSPLGQQRERVGADLEVRRQRDPVVRRPRLLADAPRRRGSR